MSKDGTWLGLGQSVTKEMINPTLIPRLTIKGLVSPINFDLLSSVMEQIRLMPIHKLRVCVVQGCKVVS